MVLLPCSRCCQPAGECACVCQCCECSSDAEQTPVDPWVHALTQPFLDLPGTSNPTNGDRMLCEADYVGLAAYLPYCGISRRWASQAACVAALKAAEKAAIIANGGPAYTYSLFSGGYPTGAEATSSLTLTERQRLWDMMMFGPVSDDMHPLLSGSVSLADEAAIDAYLDALFGVGGPLDATFDYHGYCSDCAAVAADGSYYFGWSIPYRDGEPFTAADLESLCPLGVPFKPANPPVGYAYPVFADDSTPTIRSIVLNASTGDAIADRLIETGTQGKAVVEAEVGSLPDWTKTVTVTNEDCDDVGGAWQGGKKEIDIQIDYESGAVHERWTLTVTLSTCINREDTEPDGGVGGPFVYLYSNIVFDDDVPNNPVALSLITSTASIRPYLDEDDCDGMRDDSPCADGAWQNLTPEEAGETTCCPYRTVE